MNELIMDTKKEMGKMFDHVVKTVEEHTRTTKKRLEDLDLYVTDSAGKTIIEEAENEITKI
jgi:3-oxoacyl-[acyl-carrier-protein] synthase III